MRIAILDPFSGIAGDMLLGALVDAGLDPAFLVELPAVLGLEGVSTRITRVSRGQIACHKVDFEIPPQPHGRHLKHIRAIVQGSPAPASVQAKAMEAFTRITECEAAIHGTTVEKVHLHEVGSVDAILDIVGGIWGLERLGVEAVCCGTIPLGDGFVDTQHGRMAVPTAATLRLLEGLPVRPGPEGSGELVTPTGAALVRVLSRGAPPAEFVPRASGFGAGTKDFPDRANALRLILADAEPKALEGSSASGVVARERVVMLTADVDDATGEELAALADSLRSAGALDVSLVATVMKKGRPGHRVECLCTPAQADALERHLLVHGTTIGVRRAEVSRAVLPRTFRTVHAFGESVAVKVVSLPGGGERAKPEFDDVRRVADASGRSIPEVLAEVRKSL